MAGPPGRGRGGDLSNVNTRSGIKVTKFGKQSQECWSQSQSFTFAEAAAAGGSSLCRDPHLPWLEMDSVLSSPAMNGPARPVFSVHRAATIMSQNQVTSRGGSSAMAVIVAMAAIAALCGDMMQMQKGQKRAKNRQNRCHHRIANVLCRPWRGQPRVRSPVLEPNCGADKLWRLSTCTGACWANNPSCNL